MSALQQAAAALGALAFLGTPTSAQMSFPSEPPAAGQTLLEWSDLPIMKYDIPVEQRGDVTSCAEEDESRIEETALTCFPLLQAYQQFLLLDFAAQEPSGDPQANRRLALDHAERLIDMIGAPQWPLQTYILMKTYAVQAELLADEGRMEDALAANERQIAAIGSVGGYDRDFRLAFALAKRSDLLLRLGTRSDARKMLERARPLLTRPDGARNGWAFSRHTEAIVKDAIRNGDLGYAEDMVDRYRAYLGEAPQGMRFAAVDMLDLKLYFVANRKDVAAVVRLLDERAAMVPKRNWCPDYGVLFPYVLAPVQENPLIADHIKALGCSTAVLARLKSTSQNDFLSNLDTITATTVSDKGAHPE